MAAGTQARRAIASAAVCVDPAVALLARIGHIRVRSAAHAYALLVAGRAIFVAVAFVVAAAPAATEGSAATVLAILAVRVFGTRSIPDVSIRVGRACGSRRDRWPRCGARSGGSAVYLGVAGCNCRGRGGSGRHRGCRRVGDRRYRGGRARHRRGRARDNANVGCTAFAGGYRLATCAEERKNTERHDLPLHPTHSIVLHLKCPTSSTYRHAPSRGLLSSLPLQSLSSMHSSLRAWQK